MKAQPLADRILVQADPPETITESGIIIPDGSREKPQRGTIIAVGAGTNEEKMFLEVGQRILYGKFVGIPILIDDQECLVMKMSDPLCLISEDTQ